MSNDAPDRLEEIQSLKGIERLVNRARQRLNETEMDYQSLEYWQSFFKHELEKKRTEWDELDEERQATATLIERDERRLVEINALQQEIQRKHGELETVMKKLGELDDILPRGSGYVSRVDTLWHEIYYDFKDEYSDE